MTTATLTPTQLEFIDRVNGFVNIIELLHGFYKENKRTPLTGEEYHSFKVGNFYKNVMKQKQIVKAVENVVK